MTAILNQHENYLQADQAYGFPLLIKNLLSRAKVVSGDKKIHYADKTSYTYHEFFKRVNRLANVLKGLNLQKGDVVAVMDWDTHRYLECYFAIPMCGYILQTVNVRLSEDKVLYTINHAKPKALLLNSEFSPMIKSHTQDAPSVEHVIWLDDNNTPMAPYAQGEYETMLAQASDEYEFEDFDENTIATTFYTSGTTGNPKGVFFSHRQIVMHTLVVAVANALNIEGQGLRYSDVYMPMTPMFHVHAWGFPFVATMLGLEQIYPGRYVPSTMVDLVKKHNVTTTHGVPTILQMLLGEINSRQEKFNGLKMVIGGSKLNQGLAKMAVASGIEVCTGYGMSETCPIISIVKFDETFQDMSEEQQIEHRCLSGSPVPLVDLQIWHNGKRMPNDGTSTGEIVVRSPWLTQSYYKNQDAGNELWEGGYLHTQDIGWMDAKGNVKITDRLKDVIKSGGEWISSLEIETIMSLHPSVADIAVIAIPDARWGERPMALIVLKPDYQDTKAEDIIAIAQQAYERGHLPKYGIPQDVKFIAELPKTSVGKIDKKVIRDQYAQGLFA